MTVSRTNAVETFNVSYFRVIVNALACKMRLTGDLLCEGNYERGGGLIFHVEGRTERPRLIF